MALREEADLPLEGKIPLFPLAGGARGEAQAARFQGIPGELGAVIALFAVPFFADGQDVVPVGGISGSLGFAPCGGADPAGGASYIAAGKPIPGKFPDFFVVNHCNINLISVERLASLPESDTAKPRIVPFCSMDTTRPGS